MSRQAERTAPEGGRGRCTAGYHGHSCKKRTCEICGLVWAKDWRVVLFANLKQSEVQRVALLALVYRELSEYGATGPPENSDDLYTDLEAIPRRGQPAANDRVDSATGVRWTLVRALAAPELLPELLREVAEVDPLRAGALAHAAERPTHGLRRWARVERAMDEFRATGLTATRDGVFERYVAARMSSGESLLAVLDDYYAST